MIKTHRRQHSDVKIGEFCNSFITYENVTISWTGISNPPHPSRRSRRSRPSTPSENRRRTNRIYYINPGLRRRLARERNPNAPQFVYHLFVEYENHREHPRGPKSLCTYTSYELANHDALCWLLNEQTKAGARVRAYSNDLDYERLHEGRCCSLSTDWKLCEELNLIFFGLHNRRTSSLKAVWESSLSSIKLSCRRILVI